jgi:hypothetical protein
METHNVLSKIPQSLHDDEEWRTFQKKRYKSTTKNAERTTYESESEMETANEKIKTKKRKPEEKPTRSKTIL